MADRVSIIRKENVLSPRDSGSVSMPAVTALASGSRTLMPHHHMVGFPETRAVLSRDDKTKYLRQNE